MAPSTEAFPPTLVVPDIHHRVEQVEAILAKYRDAYERVVFLGDYFDTPGDTTEQQRETCRWLQRSIQDTPRVHLLGNHDIAYFAPGHTQSSCPGWTADKQKVFEEHRAGLPLENFPTAVQVGPWLLSHAGFAPHLAQGRSAPDLIAETQGALQCLRQGRPHRHFDRGVARGGSAPCGGPLWLSWQSEFRPTPGLHQLFGHTASRGTVRGLHLHTDGSHRSSEVFGDPPVVIGSHATPDDPQWISCNICIDTRLHLVALIAPGRCEFLPA